MVNSLSTTVIQFSDIVYSVAGKGYASGYFDNGEDDFGDYMEDDECMFLHFYIISLIF